MGTAPGIFGLASFGLGPGLGHKSTISGRILRLGRTYVRVLDFSFGGRTDNGHEMIL